MKTNTIALVVSFQQGSPVLMDTLTDDAEIQVLENSLEKGEMDPLGNLYRFRSDTVKQSEEFADYVEDLLSRPFLALPVQQQGVKWLRAKFKIEQCQIQEKIAAQVIADYARGIFEKEPEKSDFVIESIRFKVRVRVFTLPKNLPA